MSNLFSEKWESIPADDLLRSFLRESPKDVDGVYNAASIYYRQELLRRLCSLFEMEGQPDTWDMDYFWTTLFLEGHIGVSDTPAGILPLRCGYSGLNMYNHPTKLLFANPVLGEWDRTIDVDGVLVHLMYNYMPAQQLIQKYATLLAMCDSSLAVNLMNSKVTFIALASNKSQANSMKKMYEKISSGEPAVYVNQDVGNPANFYFNRVKENFIGENILQVKRSIINEFLTNIGINNANTDKRERLNTDEVNSNNQEIGINISDWLYNLQTDFEKVNKIFNLNISIRRKHWDDPEQERSEEVIVNEFAESD